MERKGEDEVEKRFLGGKVEWGDMVISMKDGDGVRAVDDEYLSLSWIKRIFRGGREKWRKRGIEKRKRRVCGVEWSEVGLDVIWDLKK